MIDQNRKDSPSRAEPANRAPERLSAIPKPHGSGESAPELAGSSDCFCVGDTPVQVSFDPCGKPLDEILRAYFLRLKTGRPPL